MNQLNSGETNHELLDEWGKAIETLSEEIDTKEMRWLELSDRS